MGTSHSNYTAPCQFGCILEWLLHRLRFGSQKAELSFIKASTKVREAHERREIYRDFVKSPPLETGVNVDGHNLAIH